MAVAQSENLEKGENVILLVDQPFYGIGESITFHTLITTTEKSLETSHYVYADLVDQSGTVLVHHKIKAKNSIAKGEIALATSYTPGIYRLYVYTASMTADVAAFGAMEEIAVYSPTSIPTDLDQFPFRIYTTVEGGQLIPDVETNVYYEIEGKDQDGAKVVDLIDNDGKVVATIDLTTSPGTFKFKAEFRQSYRFNTLHDGNLFPSVKTGGTALSVETRANTFAVSVNGYKMSSPPEKLEVLSGGILIYSEDISFSGTQWATDIPKQNLSDGLLTIVVKKGSKIVNQRTVNNTFHQSKSEIAISTNKSTFTKRESVEVVIDASSTDSNIRSDMIIKVIRKEPYTERSILFPEPTASGSDISLIGLSQHLTQSKRTPIEPTQAIKATIKPVSYLDEVAFIAGYFIQDEVAAESRVENGEVNFKIPDLTTTNDCWFFGFDSFGNRLGKVELTIIDQFQLPVYSAIKKQLPVNNEVIDYLNRLKQRKIITNVFGDVKNLGEVTDPLDEPDIVNFPDQYADFDDFRSYIISVVPKATVKKKKGVENIILMPSHSYNKFRESPLYLVNSIPTYDGSAVLNIPFEEVERVEITNSLSGMGKYGLLGSNGIFKVFLTEDHDVNLDSLAETSLTIPGLNQSYNTADNQVLGKNQHVNYPDFRSLLYTSEPFYSDVSGKSIFTFSTSDILGEYEILVYGVTANGVPFHNRKSFEVALKGN
jgi:hypothetical protein